MSARHGASSAPIIVSSPTVSTSIAGSPYGLVSMLLVRRRHVDLMRVCSDRCPRLEA